MSLVLCQVWGLLLSSVPASSEGIGASVWAPCGWYFQKCVWDLNSQW